VTTSRLCCDLVIQLPLGCRCQSLDPRATVALQGEASPTKKNGWLEKHGLNILGIYIYLSIYGKDWIDL
jgi:hypothetical protein